MRIERGFEPTRGTDSLFGWGLGDLAHATRHPDTALRRGMPIRRSAPRRARSPHRRRHSPSHREALLQGTHGHHSMRTMLLSGHSQRPITADACFLRQVVVPGAGISDRRTHCPLRPSTARRGRSCGSRVVLHTCTGRRRCRDRGLEVWRCGRYGLRRHLPRRPRSLRGGQQLVRATQAAGPPGQSGSRAVSVGVGLRIGHRTSGCGVGQPMRLGAGDGCLCDGGGAHACKDPTRGGRLPRVPPPGRAGRRSCG